MQEKIAEPDTRRDDSPEVQPERHVRIVTMLVLSVAMTWVAGYWIRQAEIIVSACQITEAVPAIPGITALLFLMAINPLIRRLPLVRKLSTGEIVVVYLFVTVATTMYGCGVMRFLIACITVPYYYSTAAAPLENLAPGIPAWLSPTDPVVHRWLYEASPTGAVPWDAWGVPIAAWTGFFMLLGGTLLCFMILFAESWIDHERLVFPLVRLPLEILGEEAGVSFFRNPITWVGIGLATLINIITMVRAVFFGGPRGTPRFDLSRQITDYPWRALRPLQGHVRPGLIGLGYLISTELSFSIWFFYLFQKAQALGMTIAGYRLGGMPFAQEQGIGAYLVLGLVLLWKGRGAIRHAWEGWLKPEQARDDRLPYRWALVGVLAGIMGLMAFMVSAGMEPWLAGLYLGVLLMVGIVYGRLRAETGVPLVWAFPYGQQHKVIWNFLGQARVVGLGPDFASPTMFALMGFLSRGYFPAVSGYEIEGISLGQQTGVNWRQIGTTLMLAIGFGAASAFIFHLQPYYQEGGVGLRGGIWGWGIAKQEYTNVLRGAEMPAPPDGPRITATLFGGALILALVWARGYWFSFPLHPIGYCVAGAYGNLVWFPFLMVWLCKSLFLHYGGSQSYLRALPGFLGFALGHFITAGLIWGSLAAALGVWFG